jgi:hypothetical protein
MPITLEALCATLRPQSTALLLGAGASVPSGAMSGKALAHLLWRTIEKSDPQSDDLIETAGILERRHGRRAVVESVTAALEKLQPTGGLLGLPQFGWRDVFSTNFDRLVEKAYRACDVPLTPIRSNYDFSAKEARTGASLYKIHGCISQDRSLGDKASMILTETDYEEFDSYRQALFSSLQNAMLTGDVLVIGQSLRDRHLSDLIKKVLHYKQQGTPGQVYLLIYDRDDLRAPLLEDKGAKIAFGGIDEFVHALQSGASQPSAPQRNSTNFLPLSLVSTVVDVTHLKTAEPRVIRMFNGAAATYADIQVGATFERAQSELTIDRLMSSAIPLTVIVGAAGVGKTTFARQLLFSLEKKEMSAFEHKNDFPFLCQPWIALEAELRGKGEQAVLMLDECTRYLRQVNLLVEHLASLATSALKIVLTANAAQWGPRIKSAVIFSKGNVITLSRLIDSELHSLVNLVQFNKPIADLVQPQFKNLSRDTQVHRLRQRCSADMFVCLKNIFANDSLDQILLTEYDDLEETPQEYYRYVAALESVGMRVHRQLVMRMLNLPADKVAAVLGGLEGIVDEFEIDSAAGLYGWATRHIVIARKITEYKFSSLEELEKLFTLIIANINPAVKTELQSIRDICDHDHGIGRLGDSATRQRLYRELIKLVPAERIPWHRLIRELLKEGSLEDTEYLIRDAIEAVGADAPIDRFRVRLLIARSERTPGISGGDRLALLRKAFELAEKNISRHRSDKYSYNMYCDVASKLVEKGETPYLLDQAIDLMRRGAEHILDPEMSQDIKHYEDVRARVAYP